ncbi:MAG: DinB family protein [bacterium]|nr:DinB family protein [bacterium]
MQELYSGQLFDVIENSLPHLRKFDANRFNTGRQPGIWTAQEILGHLIDSAANNRQRFVILQYDPGQSFIRYDQDKWVQIQDYKNADWDFLIGLWAAYNRHIADIISKIPDDVISAIVKDGRLLTFRTPEKDIDLDYLIEDYIIHLKHHLGQLIDV